MCGDVLTPILFKTLTNFIRGKFEILELLEVPIINSHVGSTREPLTFPSDHLSWPENNICSISSYTWNMIIWLNIMLSYGFGTRMQQMMMKYLLHLASIMPLCTRFDDPLLKGDRFWLHNIAIPRLNWIYWWNPHQNPYTLIFPPSSYNILKITPFMISILFPFTFASIFAIYFPQIKKEIYNQIYLN